MSTALIMLAAVALDALLGEPRRAHPLVGFGRMARWIESRWHADRRVAGALAWAIAASPRRARSACFWATEGGT